MPFNDGAASMRYMLAFLAMLVSAPTRGDDGLVLPTVDFSAVAVHQAGAFQSKETIRYRQGKLRIERGNNFSVTIIDLTTQTQCILMANRTYLVLPMDGELFRRFIARTVQTTGARKRGTEHVDGVLATKYAFGDDGALKAAGFYWLSDAGIMVRREYEDGVFGQNIRHRQFLTHLRIAEQPPDLFGIPPGYKPAK
jgi:hypothetical protein